MNTENRMQYWGALHAVRSEYRLAVDSSAELSSHSLPVWVEKKYGLRMGQDDTGNYTQHYDVTDPRRFMLFQIKYMK
jgi:hypothetical protein